ncbi:MAG: response regulator [Longicatena sp.]
MLRLMIIEDEQIERETLHKIIQDNFHDIEAIYVTKNGLEALATYEQHHPQIILADINLPGMSGLEIIKRIKEYNEDCEFLILSSYNYFEYAQEAIRLGVVDFILKPYNIAQLIETLQHVVKHIETLKSEEIDKSELLEKIHKITPIMENKCVYSIIANESELIIRKNLKLLNPKLCSGFCFILTRNHYENELLMNIKDRFSRNQYHCIEQAFHGSEIVFVFSEEVMQKEDIEECAEVLNQLDFNGYTIGIGCVVNESRKLHASFLLARERCGSNVSALISLSNQGENIQIETMDVHKYVIDFMNIFEKMDEESLRKKAQALNLALISKSFQDVIDILHQLFHALLQETYQQYPTIKKINIEMEQLQTCLHPEQEVPMFLKHNLQRLFSCIVEERFKNTNALVKQAIRYIDSNYCKQITLSDLADYLHVSPYYISKLLNNSCNKTFTELVSERRVEASKKLLQSNEQIKEIAYAVGFQGQNYFTKIFKKYVGVTPKIYRNTFEDEA